MIFSAFKICECAFKTLFKNYFTFIMILLPRLLI